MRPFTLRSFVEMQLPFAAVESCYCLMANQSFVWHWGNSSFSYRQGFVAGRTRQIPHNSVLNVYDGHRASQGGTQLLSLLAENTTILGFKFVCSFFFLWREDLPPDLKCLWCLLLFPPLVPQQEHGSVPSLCFCCLSSSCLQLKSLNFLLGLVQI